MRAKLWFWSNFDPFPFIKVSHFAIVGGGTKHLRPKKHIHHPVWVTHGNSAKRLVRKKRKSPHPTLGLLCYPELDPKKIWLCFPPKFLCQYKYYYDKKSLHTQNLLHSKKFRENSLSDQISFSAPEKNVTKFLLIQNYLTQNNFVPKMFPAQIFLGHI